MELLHVGWAKLTLFPTTVILAKVVHMKLLLIYKSGCMDQDGIILLYNNPTLSVIKKSLLFPSKLFQPCLLFSVDM